VKRTEPPTPEEFNRLLEWLDPDRERAGEKYEEIRRKLIKIMIWRQCWVAEELADETINRVSHRVKDVAPTYVGDPALYFYGVLRNVYREWLRDEPPIPDPPPEPIEDQIHDCLDECLEKLDAEDHKLILEYYDNEKRARIKHRKELADERGITLNTLRMKVHRINAKLEECIVVCLNESSEAGHVLAG
jgi:DNA-directed RNA polymerase specialized sigma24 family protein